MLGNTKQNILYLNIWRSFVLALLWKAYVVVGAKVEIITEHLILCARVMHLSNWGEGPDGGSTLFYVSISVAALKLFVVVCTIEQS